MMSCLCPRPTVLSDAVRGEVLCGRCGTVMESDVPVMPSRDAGVPVQNREDYGIGTMDPQGGGGAKSVAGKRSPQGVLLAKTMSQLRQMLESVGAAGAIRAEAYALCRRMVAAGLVSGRDRTVTAGALLVLACKLHGRVIRWSDIPGISRKPRRIMKAYREIREAAGLAPSGYTEALVSRLCSDMQLSVRLAGTAIGMVESMREARFTDGKKPQCVAAAAVFLVGGGSLSKRRVAGAAGVSEPGLRRILAAWEGRRR